VRIDVHNHIYSKKLIEILEKRSDYPYSRPGQGLFCCKGLAIPRYESFYNMNIKLEEMDRVGIDIAILSINLPGPELAGGKDGDELARIGNDFIAEMVASNPKRFWGMASLGYGDIDSSLKELDRCIGQLKLRGLQIFSNIGGRTLDDPYLRPIFARMNELKRPIFMHPTVPLNQRGLMDMVPTPALGFIYDTTLAGVRLALSGVLSQYPDAPVIVPHVGGVMPYLYSRITGMVTQSFAASYGGELKEPDPAGALKRLYVDSVAYDPEPLQLCVSKMGADHVLFGSDHPHAAWNRPVEVLEQISCTDSERELIKHGNAERLFRPA
jgi:aminocarboxymuconate-semialdehyde decarboxylase